MYRENTWTIDSLREGFERFYSENLHYPAAYEINTVGYLPSCRLIQRNFGGLVKLRKSLGLEISDYTKGETRSKKASEINIRGNALEMRLETQLVELFGKHFVHSERKISVTGKSRFDYYIFTKQGEIGVDVFYPSSFYNFKAVINHKQRKYQGYSETNVYFVCGNISISQEEIDKYLSAKEKELAINIRVLGYMSFLKVMAEHNRLKAI